MKKLFFLILSFFLLLNGQSQTIKDAQKHLYYHRYEKAKDVLKTIINSGNASPDAWYWLGEIYLKQNMIDSARTVLMKGNEYFSQHNYSKKNFPLLYIGRAHMLLDSGLIAESKKEMEEILEQTKYKDPDVLLPVAMANIRSKNGDVKWALELLDKAKKRDKNNAEIYAAVGDAYRKLIDGSNAVINYDKAFDIDPSFAEVMYKEGLIYKTQKNDEVYIDRFSRAYEADSNYAPALYELYYYYYYSGNFNKAEKFLDAYIRNSDPSPRHSYLLADLYFVTKKYDAAINRARDVFKSEGNAAQPRLYKLIAYSYAASGDSTAALKNMDIYFERQNISDFVVKDFELKAELLEKLDPDKAAAAEWYEKALAADNDTTERLNYMTKLADLQKELSNKGKEAGWREQIYKIKTKPSNIDIFNWGIALYSDENYVKADSVFAIYEVKYPEQIYGYLWRARSNALIDTSMEKALAIPHYLKLIEIAAKDSLTNKETLLKAYGYLGTYEANITKNYPAAIEYFDKMLEIDPDNADAAKYSGILKNWIEENKGSK